MTLHRRKPYNNFMDEARKKKVESFLAEINVICDKYQLGLTPIIESTPDGIYPRWTVRDRLPKPEERPEVTPPTTPPVTPAEAKQETAS